MECSPSAEEEQEPGRSPWEAHTAGDGLKFEVETSVQLRAEREARVIQIQHKSLVTRNL